MESNKRAKEERLDCFVVSSPQGLFWNGAEWVRDWRAAEQFTDPPYFDPWLACHQLALSLSDRFGFRCVVAAFTGTRLKKDIEVHVELIEDEAAALEAIRYLLSIARKGKASYGNDPGAIGQGT